MPLEICDFYWFIPKGVPPARMYVCVPVAICFHPYMFERAECGEQCWLVLEASGLYLTPPLSSAVSLYVTVRVNALYIV